jgi:hypothetical protein
MRQSRFCCHKIFALKYLIAMNIETESADCPRRAEAKRSGGNLERDQSWTLGHREVVSGVSDESDVPPPPKDTHITKFEYLQ